MPKSCLMHVLPHRHLIPDDREDDEQVDDGYKMHDTVMVSAYQRLERHA
jgi:hypothetical protein